MPTSAAGFVLSFILRGVQPVKVDGEHVRGLLPTNHECCTAHCARMSARVPSATGAFLRGPIYGGVSKYRRFGIHFHPRKSVEENPEKVLRTTYHARYGEAPGADRSFSLTDTRQYKLCLSEFVAHLREVRSITCLIVE